jgi:DNA topoisomerase-1
MDDARAAASEAHLRYVSDRTHGITREKHGSGFRYRDAKGKIMRDAKNLQRIQSLVIPPAWTNVWICSDPVGHIQATGTDARGRLQYRYHPRWRAQRDKTKYDKLLDFGSHLPNIRSRIEQDLRRSALTHEKMMALCVRLLDVTHMRIGNAEYAKDNHSYGLTTLLNRHVHVHGATIEFTFRGKSGQDQNMKMRDRAVAKIILQCEELPGQHLFKYRDAQGTVHTVESTHVNEYLQTITGAQHTAKDFRTWGGTVHAAHALHTLGVTQDKRERKRRIVQAVKEAASVLGNTPATCRKYYIDPRVFEAYETCVLCEVLERFSKHAANETTALKPLEKGVMAILKKPQHKAKN